MPQMRLYFNGDRLGPVIKVGSPGTELEFAL